ncbi:MAG: vWA domain-containing protein [archaeon]
MKSKKAVFFSIDALIALIIILMILIIAIPIIKESQTKTKIHSDTMHVLSNLKVGEIDNAQIQTMITDGKIKNANKSLLEQIGEFYVTDKTLARETANEILSYIRTEKNIGIWYANELIASKNSTPIETAKNIEVERQTISGLQTGNDTTGFAARAYLSSDKQTKYFYFGGYIGDGNISSKIEFTGNATDVKIEIATDKDFDIYINEIYSGHYENSTSDIIPVEYNLNSYLSNFQSGSNIIEFTGDNLHIAGGYIKINYDGFTQENENETKIYIPGIEGIINIYDGFFIPSNLSEIEIYLHYFSNQTFFLNIGNTTILNESSTIETTRTITDAEINTLLNYNGLQEENIPFRIGLEEMEGYASAQGGDADIVFLVDTTGSMGDEIDSVVNIINQFTYVLENSSISYRLGLIQFEDYPTSPCGGASDIPYQIHTFGGEQFTTNTTEFRNKVIYVRNNMGWGNDLPESHLRAINESLTLDWRPNVRKFDILLTDAPPHATDCLQATASCCSTWCSWWSGCAITDTDENCNLGPKSAAAVTQSLINEDIKFYYIDRNNGLCANRIMADNMTNLTGGSYYEYSDASEIENIILDIAGNIINITYVEQSAITQGNITSKLFPDSYIKFTHPKKESTQGLIITSEQQFEDATEIHFDIPEGSSILNTKVISYSGPKWTTTVDINGNSIYNLSKYGSNFIELGDPYAINIPISFVKDNQTNTITTLTGLSPQNSTEPGSEYNKIIYQIQKNSSSYSSICSYISGCTWNLEFEDGTNTTINIPSNYTGGIQCHYTSTTQNYDANDALQQAVYKLLRILDLNQNNKIETKLSENSLQITPNEIEGIPFTWSTEVQIRIWN